MCAQIFMPLHFASARYARWVECSLVDPTAHSSWHFAAYGGERGREREREEMGKMQWGCVIYIYIYIYSMHSQHYCLGLPRYGAYLQIKGRVLITDDPLVKGLWKSTPWIHTFPQLQVNHLKTIGDRYIIGKLVQFHTIYSYFISSPQDHQTIDDAPFSHASCLFHCVQTPFFFFLIWQEPRFIHGASHRNGRQFKSKWGIIMLWFAEIWADDGNTIL